LDISGAMETAPRTANEVLLGLLYCICSWRLRPEQASIDSIADNNGSPEPKNYVHAYMFRGTKKNPILHLGTDKMIPRHICDKSFTVRLPDRSEWKDGFQPDTRGELFWHTVGSKINEGIGARVCGYCTRKKLSFSRRQCTTVFQAEIYAIKAYAVENIDRICKYRIVYIVSDSEAANKALAKYQINSELNWNCHKFLANLA
jgi:hypothetical protein